LTLVRAPITTGLITIVARFTVASIGYPITTRRIGAIGATAISNLIAIHVAFITLLITIDDPITAYRQPTLVRTRIAVDLITIVTVFCAGLNTVTAEVLYALGIIGIFTLDTALLGTTGLHLAPTSIVTAQMHIALNATR
jgi:hypothetical protein